MDQKVLTGIIVAGVFASLGFVFKEWTTWTTSTLVDLNNRTAVMEAEMKHTNDMIAQNHEMLKALMNRVQRAGFDVKAFKE